MPAVTDTEIDGFAHCGQPRCPGSSQQPVKAVRRETFHTYRERGGNAPGVESSFVTLSFADPSERDCPACGRAREVTDQARKTYAPLSGHDPMGLLGAQRFDPAKQAELRQSAPTDAEREAFEAEKRAFEAERMAAVVEP